MAWTSPIMATIHLPSLAPRFCLGDLAEVLGQPRLCHHTEAVPTADRDLSGRAPLSAARTVGHRDERIGQLAKYLDGCSGRVSTLSGSSSSRLPASRCPSTTRPLPLPIE